MDSPSDTPNQEEFKNLIVEPADIRPRNRSWDTSRREIVVHVSKKAKQQTEVCTEYESDPRDSKPPFDLADSNGKDDQGSPEADECEIITFIIGAANRDTSKPMPPPTRFVRKGGFQQ
jgi:hypothetical protein